MLCDYQHLAGNHMAKGVGLAQEAQAPGSSIAVVHLMPLPLAPALS